VEPRPRWLREDDRAEQARIVSLMWRPLALFVCFAGAVDCSGATPHAPKAGSGRATTVPRLVLGVETLCVLNAGSPADCEGAYAAEIEALGAVQALALGDDRGCAITVDGRLWCWGGDAAGEVVGCHGGHPPEASEGSELPGMSATRCKPRPIELPAKATRVWAGSMSTCTTLQDGVLFCAGRGWFGASTRHQQVTLDVPFIELAFADDHACLLSGEGTVRCLGANDAGQLGDGTAESRTATVAVVGLPKVRALDVSERRSCALDHEGGVWCWGNRGVDSIEIDRTPARVTGARLETLTIERLSTCGLDAEGNAHCAGSSSGGRIGFAGGRVNTLTHATAFGTDADELAASVQYTCARRDTTLRCVGEVPSRAPALAASFLQPSTGEPKSSGSQRYESATCVGDDDCVLALRIGCCGRCSGDSEYIAVHRNRALAQKALACPEPMTCPACLVPSPRERAECVSGACSLTSAP
jgi:hypothetical protein